MASWTSLSSTHLVSTATVSRQRRYSCDKRRSMLLSSLSPRRIISRSRSGISSKNASNEKAYVFVVVHKFNLIKNKEKCRRMVLEQVKELSPRTYEDANDLVHFVDSLEGKDDPSFEDLEAACVLSCLSSTPSRSLILPRRIYQILSQTSSSSLVRMPPLRKRRSLTPRGISTLCGPFWSG
jgi:hypothetical protein